MNGNYKRLTPHPHGEDRVAGEILGSARTAVAEGFGRVPKSWIDRTLEIETERERLAATEHERESIYTRLAELEPVVSSTRFAVKCKDRVFFPDEYAVGQLGSLYDIGTHYAHHLQT